MLESERAEEGKEREKEKIRFTKKRSKDKMCKDVLN